MAIDLSKLTEAAARAETEIARLDAKIKEHLAHHPALQEKIDELTAALDRVVAPVVE